MVLKKISTNVSLVGIVLSGLLLGICAKPSLSFYSDTLVTKNTYGDQMFPFDLDGSGKLDHLVCYRPGKQVVWILKRDQSTGIFSPVFQSTSGIGGFNLDQWQDVITPFDYYSDGTANELICYRPGWGIIWILKNSAPVGSTPNYNTILYQSSNGINCTNGQRYDLSVGSTGIIRGDQIFAFDLNGTGKLDHLVCYRHASKVIWIIENNGGVF